MQSTLTYSVLTSYSERPWEKDSNIPIVEKREPSVREKKGVHSWELGLEHRTE